ncbi:MAG: metallophosphoesterase [Synechococcaceae cyanobacterium]
MQRLLPTCRILQLSDPHLLADPRGRCRGVRPLERLQQALRQGLAEVRRRGPAADLLLISGDLCEDESWGGYVRLRELLEGLPLPVALLPGNHDRPLYLAAVLGRRAVLAPALVPCGAWDLLLLDSHRPGCVSGWLGAAQLTWLEGLVATLADRGRPLLVALHHPPLPIGDPLMDTMLLEDRGPLLATLAPLPQLRGLVFGHIHQHWQGWFPGRPEVPLLGCPSTLVPFGPVQPCPLGRPQAAGGRLLELAPDGHLGQLLLRWDPPEGS